MKRWTLVLSLAAVVLCGQALAAEKGKEKGKGEKKPVDALIGKIVSVAPNATDDKLTDIVVKTHGKESKEVTVQADESTTVTIDKEAAKPADLKADMYVKITPATGKAEKIVASTQKPEKKEKPAEK